MRIRGREIKGPNELIVVIPRPSHQVPVGEQNGQQEQSGDIVFKVQAVLDYSEFEKMCPQPEPPKIKKVGQTQAIPDFTDPKYTAFVNNWAEKRTHYMVIKSLEATKDLEWATVQLNDPDSWKNYITELKDAGFTTAEVNRVISAVSQVNGLDEDKFEEARLRFLRSQVAAV